MRLYNNEILLMGFCLLNQLRTVEVWKFDRLFLELVLFVFEWLFEELIVSLVGCSVKRLAEFRRSSRLILGLGEF